MSKIKLRINGYARHGKDTVADIIVEKYGLTKPDPSRYIAGVLRREVLPEGWYPDDETCYQDRINHRTGWFNFISNYNKENHRLVHEVMVQGDIYVGERRRKCFEATRGLFDWNIWVCAAGRGLPPEPKASCELTEEGHEIIIRNYGTYDELVSKVDEVMEYIQLTLSPREVKQYGNKII